MLRMNRPDEGWKINLWRYLEKSRPYHGEFSHKRVVVVELK